VEVAWLEESPRPMTRGSSDGRSPASAASLPSAGCHRGSRWRRMRSIREKIGAVLVVQSRVDLFPFGTLARSEYKSRPVDG